MPLIECPDCQSQISDLAPACPKCGRPMKVHHVERPATTPATPVAQAAPHVQTIEATGKQWKAIQLIGGLIAMAGFGSCAFTSGEGMFYSYFLGVGGLAIMVYASLGAWWQHG